MLADDFLHDFRFNFQVLVVKNHQLFVLVLFHQKHALLACTQNVCDHESVAILVEGIVRLVKQDASVCLELQDRRSSQSGKRRSGHEAP